MHKRKAKVSKEKGSDDETEIEQSSNVHLREPTHEEIQARELEMTPVIPDSEISPAAYIF